MSRMPRELSETGLYHIIFRGLNRQNIFEEEADFYMMKNILRKTKEENAFNIYAYCFMSNHGHLFIEENQAGDISYIMHRILTKYAGWYNKKYIRSGSLFGNRYKSEPVEKDSYLLSLLRYIHQNPLKAGIVKDLSQYKWSSYNEYIGALNNGITDIEFILKMLANNKNEARISFIDFHNEIEKDSFDIIDSRKRSEEQIRRRIIKLLDGKEPHAIGGLPKEERNNWIKILREKEGFSIREIERATGISRGIISRIM